MKTSKIIILVTSIFCLFSCGDGSIAGSGATGSGGSTARFSIVGEHLYVLNTRVTNSDRGISQMQPTFRATPVIDTLSLASPEIPTRLSSIELKQSDPETLMASGDRLFVGAQNGMEIYSLEDPERPFFRSEFRHFRSCDPVVTDGDIAFVTLKGNGGRCAANGNELNVVDISDLENPRLISRLGLTAPEGLGVLNQTAYICDGDAGLSVVNVDAAEQPVVVHSLPDIACFDVIASEDGLITTGFSGIRQYNIADDPLKPQLQSIISLAGDQ